MTIGSSVPFGALVGAGVLWTAACSFPEIAIDENLAGSGSASGTGEMTGPGGGGGSGGGAGGGTSSGTGGENQGGAGGDAGPCSAANDCIVEDRDGDGHVDVACGGDDCDDCDPDVFPGQLDFFEVPRAKGGFDYDCNGTSEFKYETVQCGTGTCGQSNKFVSPTVITCGQSGPFGGCKSVVVVGCQNDVKEERTQGCR